MAVNLTNLIDLDGLRAFKAKNDEARAAAITEAQTDHDRHFVAINYASGAAEPAPGTIMVPTAGDAISGSGTKEDPYIVDFTVVYVDSTGENPKYFKNTSSDESSTASLASTSDIEALFS